MPAMWRRPTVLCRMAMILPVSTIIARRLLDTYAAVWYVSTPAQRERVLRDAAELVRKEIERLVVALNSPEHDAG